MATGGRKNHLQVTHTIARLISSTDNPAAAGSNSVLIGRLPAGALLLNAHVNVGTLFNSTTNTVSLGSASGGAQFLAATDLKTAARTDTLVPTAAAGPLAADTDVWMTLTNTGAAPTAGAAVVALEYIAHMS
jgi:hypothetical protein